MLIYIDGKLVPKEDARISVFDHGFLYGDGVFEGIRVYEGNVFRLKEHIERLYESAKTLDLEIPMSPEGLTRATLDTVAAMRCRRCSQLEDGEALADANLCRAAERTSMWSVAGNRGDELRCRARRFPRPPLRPLA